MLVEFRQTEFIFLFRESQFYLPLLEKISDGNQLGRLKSAVSGLSLKQKSLCSSRRVIFSNFLFSDGVFNPGLNFLSHTSGTEELVVLRPIENKNSQG